MNILFNWTPPDFGNICCVPRQNDARQRTRREREITPRRVPSGHVDDSYVPARKEDASSGFGRTQSTEIPVSDVDQEAKTILARPQLTEEQQQLLEDAIKTARRKMKLRPLNYVNIQMLKRCRDEPKVLKQFQYRELLAIYGKAFWVEVALNMDDKFRWEECRDYYIESNCSPVARFSRTESLSRPASW
mmetsp:Transcript_74603/g.199714  ORF Transcript_74603/g.199714 Transcript_74603/m.199714 type:complete len:189 (-) Transcript_74603:1006-1572(-)